MNSPLWKVEWICKSPLKVYTSWNPDCKFKPMHNFGHWSKIPSCAHCEEGHSNGSQIFLSKSFFNSKSVEIFPFQDNKLQEQLILMTFFWSPFLNLIQFSIPFVFKNCSKLCTIFVSPLIKQDDFCQYPIFL